MMRVISNWLGSRRQTMLWRVVAPRKMRNTPRQAELGGDGPLHRAAAVEAGEEEVGGGHAGEGVPAPAAEAGHGHDSHIDDEQVGQPHGEAVGEILAQQQRRQERSEERQEGDDPRVVPDGQEPPQGDRQAKQDHCGDKGDQVVEAEGGVDRQIEDRDAAHPPPAWAQGGARRAVYSASPTMRRPATTPRITRPVGPIHWLSKASLRKKPAPTARATAPTMANQLRPRTRSQSSGLLCRTGGRRGRRTVGAPLPRRERLAERARGTGAPGGSAAVEGVAAFPLRIGRRGGGALGRGGGSGGRSRNRGFGHGADGGRAPCPRLKRGKPPGEGDIQLDQLPDLPGPAPPRPPRRRSFQGFRRRRKGGEASSGPDPQ